MSGRIPESGGAYSIVDAPSLAERTSIRLGGRAIAEIRLHRLAGLEAVPELVEKLGGRLALLGEGTNIIASDETLPLVLLTLPRGDEATVRGDEGGRVLLRAAGGMRLPALLAQAAVLGLSGLEGLAGIPGSVGGALAMNAGSFGVEMGDLATKVTVFSPALGLVERPAEDFDFGYRNCRLRGHEGWFLVCGLELALTASNRDSVRDRMRAIYAKKQASQPVTARSAGCVFKNPAPDAPAGRLLDEAGLKGFGVGGMRFSRLHANFLVNEGGGTFAVAEELMELALEKVRARSGHELEKEVRIWR